MTFLPPSGRAISCLGRIAATLMAAAVVLAPVSAAQQAPVQTAPPQATPPQTPPRVPSFRSTIDVVSMSVTVMEAGPGTRFVTDLKQPDFEVYEDGVKQDITVFNNINAPIALALLIDSSASMDEPMPTVHEAAIGFSRRLREQDLAEVIDFDSRAFISQAFTNDVPLLERAIKKISAGGSTSLFQALYIAMAEFKKLRSAEPGQEPRRQAVILLSDGADTSSMFTFDDIIDIVKRSETAVYTIGIRDPRDPEDKSFNQARFNLRQFAQETGGRSFFPNQLGDLSNVYGQISDELSSQYSLGYTSKNTRRDGAWRRIVVRTSRSNVMVRTKQGYFAGRN